MALALNTLMMAAAIMWAKGTEAATKYHARYGAFQARCAAHGMPKGYGGLECRTEAGLPMWCGMNLTTGAFVVAVDGSIGRVDGYHAFTALPSHTYPNAATARDAYQGYREVEYVAHNAHCTEAHAARTIKRHRTKGIKGSGKVVRTHGTAKAATKGTKGTKGTK